MKISFLLLYGLLYLRPSFSQSINRDSLNIIQIKNAVDLYDSYTGGNKPIFNGGEYIYYAFRREGEPFFITGRFTKGWVSYKGKIYDSVSIFYDIERDQLVILNADSISPIVMHNEFIDSFNLLGHTFISLKEDHQQNLYNTGFYDRLYNGHIQLFARRIKGKTDVIRDLLVITVFFSKDHFYIYKEGMYYLINNQKDVFRLFNDHKHEIRKMMHKAGLKFKHRDFENTLIKVTEYYDKLIH